MAGPYVEPITSGSITRTLTAGVNLITEWVANRNASANTVGFTLTHYLQTTKNISVSLSTYSSMDEVSTQVNGVYAITTDSFLCQINDRTSDFFVANNYGGYQTLNLSAGKHYITTAPGNDVLYGNDNTDKEFSYNFKISLRSWTFKIDGTSYSAGNYTEEIPPINPDKRDTASMPATYIGDFARISVHRANSEFKHSLSYEFGSLSGSITVNTQSTTYSWQVPWEFLSQFVGDSAQATGTLKCTTYRKNGQYYGETTSTFIVMLDVNVAGPTFNPVVTDTNSTTVALTGNNKILVKFFSDAHVVSGAAGQGNATIVSQSIENNGVVVSAGTGDFEKVESGVFRFVATDSRKFTSTSAYTASFVDYSKLTCNLLMGYPTTGGDLDMTITGNFFNSSFGQVENTLTLQYRYKTQGGNYGSWTNVNVSKNGNYKFETTLSGFDYKQPFVFQARAIDKLMTIESVERVVVGYPIFDWGQDDFKFNVPVGMRGELYMSVDQPIIGMNNYGEGKVALTPLDSIGNTVLGYGNYQDANGDTMIYGNNVHIFANEDITFNGTTLEELPTICHGKWVPYSLVSNSPTKALGNYIRVGDMCILNFFYQAVATTTLEKIVFTGLPYSPDPDYRWQSGGGNMSGGNLGLDQTAFSGWTIENTDGTWGICGRSVGNRNTADYAPTESSGYVGVSVGSTFYASGTLMYKIVL